MDRKLFRVYLIELIGTFGLVYVSAGVVLVNMMASPVPLDSANPAYQPLTGYQPGVVGIALAQGLTLAVLLCLTVPVAGGYLNPAVTIMLWVFNRLDSIKTAWFLGAQLLGAALAGYCLRQTFDASILVPAQYGTPHMTTPGFAAEVHRGTLFAGTGIELVLTFFLVFAIFGLAREAAGRLGMCVGAGAVLAAGVLVAFPLTGAGLNPARWFGTVFWEWAAAEGTRRPLGDAFVYIAGPILGALLGGLVYFKAYEPAVSEAKEK
jgi:glycerol uptake facilitator-like aquaporin